MEYRQDRQLRTAVPTENVFSVRRIFNYRNNSISKEKISSRIIVPGANEI
jgi:hypothetical protein